MNAIHRSIATCLLLAFSLAAHAADALPPRWSLDINAASVHTEAWARKKLNQDNPGLGVEYRFDNDWSAAGGIYRNSYRRTSVYALCAWTPWRTLLSAVVTG